MQHLPVSSNISRKKVWLLLLLALAVVSIVLLAAGLPRLQLQPGQPIPIGGIIQALNQSNISFSGISIPFNIVRLVVACIWVLIFISIIGFIVSSEIRKEVFKRVIIYSLWALLFYGVITQIQPFLNLPEPEEEGAAEGGLGDIADTIEPLPTPPDFVVDPPQWIIFAVSILLITLMAGIIWMLWRFFYGSRKKRDTSLDLLTQEAQQALDDIQAGRDLKDTIRRCYFEMSQILGKQRHLHRRRGMTPREFEQFLAESGLRTEHIKRLTRLFESVRYGNKPAGHREELEAVDCLSAIVKSYGQPS